MARESVKASKSESLTIRLDPKTRFVLEYVSRLNGQTITTVVERAIHSAAAERSFYDDNYGRQLGWQDFWNVSEGVRALSMSQHSEFFPTYEEEKRLAFCKEHWPFFWFTKERKSYITHYIDVLWPRIDEFVQAHDDFRSTDYFAAGRAMQAALKGAKLQSPEWPSLRTTKTKDDDIPF